MALRLTLPVPATMLPVPERLPVASVIEMVPLLVVTLVPRARLLASLTVSVWAAPVTLATSVLTLVLRVELFCARTLRTLPMTWLEEVLSVIPPWLALRVTLAEPAMMLPEPLRLPAARLIEMSPLLVTTLVPTARRVFCSLTVRDCPAPVMLATSVLTLLLTAELPLAVTFSTLPATWPAELLSVTLPWLTLSVTLPKPATMLPAPERLPCRTSMRMSPLLVETPGGTIVSPSAMTPLPGSDSSRSKTARDCDEPVMAAVKDFTDVWIAEEFAAVMLSTLAKIAEFTADVLMLPFCAKTVTLPS